MPNTDLTLGSDATAANNLILRADGAGGGSIRNGAGTELVKVPAGGVPAFKAYATGVTSVTASWVKIALAGEVFDTANAFDSTTNYRFTPQVAGYYQINGHVHFGGASYAVGACIYKNGAAEGYGAIAVATAAEVCSIVYLNGSTDYVDLYGYSATTQNSDASGVAHTRLTGILIKAT